MRAEYTQLTTLTTPNCEQRKLLCGNPSTQKPRKRRNWGLRSMSTNLFGPCQILLPFALHHLTRQGCVGANYEQRKWGSHDVQGCCIVWCHFPDACNVYECLVCNRWLPSLHSSIRCGRSLQPPHDAGRETWPGFAASIPCKRSMSSFRELNGRDCIDDAAAS